MSSSTITYKGAEINCVGFTQWCIETQSSALDDYVKHVHDVMEWLMRNPNSTYEQYLLQKKQQAQGDEEKQIAGEPSDKEVVGVLDANNTVAAASGTKYDDEDSINSGPFDNKGHKGGDADALHTNEGSECHN